MTKPETSERTTVSMDFYTKPSPVGAVELAISDHKAFTKNFPIWEYVAELQKARDQAKAYPKLVALLQSAVDDDAEWMEDASDLLRELGK